ncbi:MAG: copper amine oxidase N-terminal domain-containing protein [Defluviitaleaceae bacterium]|nr:copper amine oxidase N-terminal domain-containing protein [Defluviitaleaceae bacterium]
MRRSFFKRAAAIALVASLAFAAFAPVSLSAAEETVLRFEVGSTTFHSNGVAGTLDAAPFNQDGRVMVPLRQIGEAIGAEVIAFEDNTAIIDEIHLPIGVPLAGGMGTPVIVDGRTFVPLGFIAGEIGATPRWDGAVQAAYIYIGVEPAAQPTPVAQPTPAAPPTAGQAPTGENTPGILVASGDVAGAMIVTGTDTSVWPFSEGNEEGYAAFVPVPGETYRISFNITNRFNAGWRIRWAVGPSIFGTGANTPADYEIVNSYPVSVNAVATVVPAHFNVDVERNETYTLVIDVYFDGSQGVGGLIGNIGLTGTAGESSFDVNWITVEHNGQIIAQWAVGN